MQTVLSFVKLFSHERFDNINMADLYTIEEQMQMRNTVNHNHPDRQNHTVRSIIFNRASLNEHVVLTAHDPESGQTWVKWTTDNDIESGYVWGNRVHTLDMTDWDLSFIAPEMSMVVHTQRNYRNYELTLYPELFAFMVAYIVETVDEFKDMLNSALVDIEHTHEIFTIPYTGKQDTNRVGRFVFLTGQKNEKLLHSIISNYDKLRNNNTADAHILPYIGTLFKQVPFDTLMDCIAFLKNAGGLRDVSDYILSDEHTIKICTVLDALIPYAESALNELMENNVQTVTAKQLETSSYIKRHMNAGGKVNLLLELENTTWAE